MGINVPDMGTKKSATKVSEAAALYASASLSDVLFTETQRRVLACLFDGAGQSRTVSELIRITGSGSGAVQREVARLSGSGLLAVEQVGNQKRYHADPQAPIHDELVSIVRKTFGLAGPLRDALAPLADRIDAAFVYGSVAKGGDTAASDIDLMVISDTLGYADVVGALHPLIEQMAREINPTLYSRAELANRIAGSNAFVTRVLAQPKIWIYGEDDALGA
jgi:predicted nucleotidyltransferase/predicted transcriptional regulator